MKAAAVQFVEWFVPGSDQRGDERRTQTVASRKQGREVRRTLREQGVKSKLIAVRDGQTVVVR